MARTADQRGPEDKADRGPGLVRSGARPNAMYVQEDGRPMTRLYMGCRSRFTPARDHHRLCWSCWRETDRRLERLRIAALVRDGVRLDTAQTLVAALGARIVDEAAR
jgi:hypothetical protein